MYTVDALLWFGTSQNLSLNVTSLELAMYSDVILNESNESMKSWKYYHNKPKLVQALINDNIESLHFWPTLRGIN